MQNDIGEPERAHSSHGEQIRIARSRPNQIYLSCPVRAWSTEQESSSEAPQSTPYPHRLQLEGDQRCWVPQFIHIGFAGNWEIEIIDGLYQLREKDWFVFVAQGRSAMRLTPSRHIYTSGRVAERATASARPTNPKSRIIVSPTAIIPPCSPATVTVAGMY